MYKLISDVDIAGRMKQARIKAGFTKITEASKAANVTRKHIYNIESGNNFPHCLTLVKLCNAYGITPNDILL